MDSSVQLDSLDVIISKVDRKLASLRTQLGAVMQTQLDELTDSLNTVRLIKENTMNIKNRFDDVRNNCRESLRSLRTNTKIDQLYIARKNVLSVVNQIRFTEELPERLKTMSARLNEDYTCLKVVYDEWIQYYSWTQKLKSQIEVISSPTTKEFTEGIYEECFKGVASLGQLLEEKLWEHIYRCMELAQLDPAALVRALTIIEKNQHRRLRAIDFHEHGEEVASWVLNDRDWVGECKDRLLTAIQRRCEHAYNQGNTMKDKLRIGMQLLADLEVVRTKVVPCFPPHYNILQFFIDQYALIANNNMEPFYDDPTLEPGEILVLVEWLDSFCEEVKSWGGADVPVFVEAKKRLMDKFELACTTRMQLWFKRILERNDSAMENDDGLLVTAVPEDIFSLIKTQAELAGEHLKDYALCDAIRICTSTIQTYTEYYQQNLADYSDRDLCALINNNNNLRELIEGIPDMLSDSLTEDAVKEMNAQLSQVTAQLLDLNTAAAHALSDMIIGDIDTARVLEDKCFTEEWLLQEEAEGILTMTSTYQDYFNDLTVWIQSKYFLGMVMIDCLHNSVKRYLKCFSLSTAHFDDGMTIGARIKTDYDSLMSYFTSDAVANVMKYTDRRYRNGEYIAEVLEPIRNLEIFFKQPAEMIVVNGEITDEGYRLMLALVGGRMMQNGIQALMMARSDIGPEDKIMIMNKFSMFN